MSKLDKMLSAIKRGTSVRQHEAAVQTGKLGDVHGTGVSLPETLAKHGYVSRGGGPAGISYIANKYGYAASSVPAAEIAHGHVYIRQEPHSSTGARHVVEVDNTTGQWKHFSQHLGHGHTQTMHQFGKSATELDTHLKQFHLR